MVARHLSLPPRRCVSSQMIFKETIQGFSYCSRIGPIVAWEPPASNERFNLSLTKFNEETPQALPSSIARPAHANGRR
jgi:hypothetical protein